MAQHVLVHAEPSVGRCRAIAITNQAIPPKKRTPTPAHGRGDDHGLGPCGVDGNVEIPSGEAAGRGEVAASGAAASGCTVGGKGEFPDDMSGRTGDVIVDADVAAAGTVAATGGVGLGGTTAVVGVAVGGGGTSVGVGKGGVSVGGTVVGVGSTFVGVGRTSVGVGGNGVGETARGETGDWNQAPSVGPPSTAKSNLVRSKSSTICTADLRFDTCILNDISALDAYVRAKWTTVTPVSPSPSAPSRNDSTRG